MESIKTKEGTKKRFFAKVVTNERFKKVVANERLKKKVTNESIKKKKLRMKVFFFKKNHE